MQSYYYDALIYLPNLTISYRMLVRCVLTGYSESVGFDVRVTFVLLQRINPLHKAGFNQKEEEEETERTRQRVSD